MIRRRASCVARAVLPGIIFALNGSLAQAQLSAWLDFDGAIKGEATQTAHKDWIEILGFNVGNSRGISTAGGGGKREASRPSLTELSLARFVDRATPALFTAATAAGSPYPMVTLDLNMGNNVPFARIELENVLVSGQSFTASSGAESRPSETISLNFTKISYTYILPDLKTLTADYDIAENSSGSGTGVTNPDSDNDGMADAWERTYGLAVGSNDSGGDLDGDGLTNLQEYQLGTNPKSGTSFFKATLSAAPSTPGTYQLTWNSVPGKTYIIEWSPDLTTPFVAQRTVTATAATTTESIINSGATGFYRVRPQ